MLGVDSARLVKRGDWVATFELWFLGHSDHVGIARATPLVFPDKKVRYGQPLLKLARADNSVPVTG